MRAGPCDKHYRTPIPSGVVSSDVKACNRERFLSSSETPVSSTIFKLQLLLQLSFRKEPGYSVLQCHCNTESVDYKQFGISLRIFLGDFVLPIPQTLTKICHNLFQKAFNHFCFAYGVNDLFNKNYCGVSLACKGKRRSENSAY